MALRYEDSRFGVEKLLGAIGTTAALNGTVGATVLGVIPQGLYGSYLTRVGVNFVTGGTGATRQLLIGTAAFSGGTLGTVGYVGTVTLGTQANLTGNNYVLGTGAPQGPGNTYPLAPVNTAIVVSQQGTDAVAYSIGINVYGVEAFTNL